MPKYLVLPIEKPDTFQGLSPQQMQRVVERYVKWTQGLACGNSPPQAHGVPTAPKRPCLCGSRRCSGR